MITSHSNTLVGVAFCVTVALAGCSKGSGQSSHSGAADETATPKQISHSGDANQAATPKQIAVMSIVRLEQAIGIASESENAACAANLAQYNRALEDQKELLDSLLVTENNMGENALESSYRNSAQQADLILSNLRQLCTQ